VLGERGLLGVEVATGGGGRVRCAEDGPRERPTGGRSGRHGGRAEDVAAVPTGWGGSMVHGDSHSSPARPWRVGLRSVPDKLDGDFTIGIPSMFVKVSAELAGLRSRRREIT
jgi:hypothetical protein